MADLLLHPRASQGIPSIIRGRTHLSVASLYSQLPTNANHPLNRLDTSNTKIATIKRGSLFIVKPSSLVLLDSMQPSGTCHMIQSNEYPLSWGSLKETKRQLT